MKKFIFIAIIFSFGFNLIAQRNTLSGIVYDSQSGETLVGATIQIQEKTPKGTATNVNGFFSLAGIETNTVTIITSFIGYENKTQTIQFPDNHKTFIEIRLKPSTVEIDQINVVEAAPDIIGDREIETSQHRLTPKAMKSIPTARNDVFKAIKFMPGIEATEPLSPLVSVRGSDPGENLIMLDGVTIYNPYHFMSSSGIFNMQTVKNVDMLVGGFGAEYGGRNSSVIHISTKDGTEDGVHGEVIPSTVESKVFVEFPVSKKTTMMVGARFNYDVIGNFVLNSNSYFYDANFSLTHRFNPKNRLTIKYFTSRDKTSMDFNTIYKLMGNTLAKYTDPEIAEPFQEMSFAWNNKWNNNIATAIYKSVITPKLFFRTQVYASLHNANNSSQFKMDFDDIIFNTSTAFKSKVQDWTAKAYLDYRPFYNNQLKVGAEYSLYLFSNESIVNEVENASASSEPKLLAFFAEDKIKLGSLILRPGIRFTKFQDRKIKYEPRINGVLNLPFNWKIKAAYGLYYQYIISMNTQELEFSQFLDYYYPLAKVEPSESYHYIIGLEKKVGKNQFLSADFYFKDIHRTYTFDLLQSKLEAFALSDKIFAGSGESYGMELMWKGQHHKFSGWASYTLAKSTRSFPNIMDGKEYLYDYNHTHTFKGVINFQATDKISYSTDFMFQSGVPRSVENALQFYYMYDPIQGEVYYSPQYTINQKNSSQMPWIMSINLGLQKKVVRGFGKDISNFFGAKESYLVVNVRNLLFLRRNVMFYLPVQGFDKYIPFGDNYFPTASIGYTIKF
ncbi:MAG: TonB-dependent receptor [Salinivirgaceae bacterium]|nr:TonB-dependent receptor [Salinivirgaceae bacterium]